MLDSRSNASLGDNSVAMGKGIVVVGGSSGLGKVLASRYLNSGYRVAIVSRNCPSFIDGTDNAAHFSVDLTGLSVSGASVLAEGIGSYLGAINYVVFCQRYRGAQPDLSHEIAVSVTATERLIEAFRSYFAHEGDCAIACVGSVYADFVGSSQPLSYHVAKAGLNALIRYYAVALGEEGIRVNSISPLTYLKDESKHVYLDNPRAMEKYRRLVPLKRMPTAAECADALHYLCSPQASFINGQTLYVDGGVSAVWPEELA